jgi:cephalosporin hydroxylase
MITTKDLYRIAQQCIDEPWGMGHPELEKVDEVWNSYYRFLYDCVFIYTPEAVLETGVYKGVASGHMAAASPTTVVIGIDLNILPEAQVMMNSFGNISYITGNTVCQDTYNLVDSILNGKKIGLLFLDSCHDGDTPLSEFTIYSKFFADECIVCCDDIHALYADQKQQDAMRAFWNILPGDKIDLSMLHDAYGDVKKPGFGASIVRKNRQ